MTMFHEGPNPQPRTPAADCYAFTLGYELDNGQATPCTADGQRADFVFGDTVDADPDAMHYAVPVLSHVHSGGTAVPLLAGGAVAPGHEFCVVMHDFENNDGDTVSLPVAQDIDDADDGAMVIGRATHGSSASGADTDINRPSIAGLIYPAHQQYPKGGEQTRMTLAFPVDLATIAATGDVVTQFPAEFDGVILSDRFVVNQPVATAAKAVDLNLEVNAANVTGGVIALTSAAATPQGKTIAGTAITANNTFSAGDTISIEATVTAAFAEGSGTIYITIEQTATA